MSKESALATLSSTTFPLSQGGQEGQMSTSIDRPSSSVSSSSEDSGTEKSKEISSDSFAQLAKKEADLLRQRQEFKREQELIAQEKKKIWEIKTQYEEYQSLKSKDPIAAMKKMGFSEADIINYLAAEQPKELTADEKAAKIAAETAEAKFKEYQEAQTKKLTETQNQENQRIIQDFKGTLGKTLEAHTEKFPFAAHYGRIAQDLAFETVAEVVKQSNGEDILTPLEALQLVNEHYESEYEAMSNLKKRVVTTPTEAPPSEPLSTTPYSDKRTRTLTPADPHVKIAPTVSRTRTLTNSATATTASLRQPQNETREQKRSRLIQKLRTGS